MGVRAHSSSGVRMLLLRVQAESGCQYHPPAADTGHQVLISLLLPAHNAAGLSGRWDSSWGDGASRWLLSRSRVSEAAGAE